MTARTISVAERRARLGVRHRLAPGTKVDDDVAAVASSVVVLHATDPASVVLSALARMARPDPSAVEAALYDDRTVVRMLGMRRTLFTVPTDLAPVVQASSTLAVAATQRRRLEKDLAAAGIADPGRWLRKVEAAVLVAVADLGPAPATEITKRVPELGRRIVVAPGTKHAAEITVTSRVLVLLGADGHLVRGRTTGAWNTSRHRWARTADWLGAPLLELDPAEAQVTLVRRWLERFGPGTAADLKWWTGWTMGATRAALARVDAVEVDLEGEVGHLLSDDLAPVRAPKPWVALLPGLDPSAMGWTGRGWYLADEHKPLVVDRTGNIGATVWVDGRIVGGWAQRKDGEVVTRLLEDVGSERAAAVAEEAARLQAVIGDVRVVPRFPAPLDRELGG